MKRISDYVLSLLDKRLKLLALEFNETANSWEISNDLAQQIRTAIDNKTITDQSMEIVTKAIFNCKELLKPVEKGIYHNRWYTVFLSEKAHLEYLLKVIQLETSCMEIVTNTLPTQRLREIAYTHVTSKIEEAPKEYRVAVGEA